MTWTLLFTNTSVKLSLKLVIFLIFCLRLHHQITAQEIIFSRARLLGKQRFKDTQVKTLHCFNFVSNCIKLLLLKNLFLKKVLATLLFCFYFSKL
jgi:hypothetical protein